MADRIVAWVSAGILAAGVSAASIAGAAVASADDDSGASAETSSHATGSTDTVKKPHAPKQPGVKTDTGSEATDKASAENRTDKPAAEKTGHAADQVDTTNDKAASGSERNGAVGAPELAATSDTLDPSVPTEEVVVTALDVVDETPVVTSPESPPVSVSAAKRAPGEQASGSRSEAVETQPSPSVAQLVMTNADQAEATTPARFPSLLNAIGSLFWGVFDLAIKLVDFPPTAPPGSTVTAGRSKLEIDCGDGYTTDADWYFPTASNPDKFIYFQHGFPARAGFYNLTLAELAERNNAIVFAPNITANIFACDACALSGEPMQAAVARLFEGDREALLASAEAAGFTGVVPEQFVLTGQSAGAPMAVAAARYYNEFAPAAEQYKMLGVILYDVSNTGGAKKGSALTNALEKLPDTIPVLNITAEPAPVNLFGDANPALAELRPGQFNGVQLVGGAHADAFRSSTLFGLPQLFVTLFFGASKPENVEAVHVLTEGWLTDMYAHRVYNPATRTGIYGTPGAPGQVVVDIPTDAGLAHGYVLPAPIRTVSPFEKIIVFVLGLINVNYYAICAVDPESASAQSTLTCSA